MAHSDRDSIEVNGITFATVKSGISNLFQARPGFKPDLIGVFASEEVAKKYLAALAKEDLSTMRWAGHPNGPLTFLPTEGWGDAGLKIPQHTYFVIESITVIVAESPFKFEGFQQLPES